MQNENYVERGKSFLSRNTHRLALRVVPMALIAVTAAHAAPGGPANFGTPGGFVSSGSSPCSGGATSGSIGGVVANAGLGVILSGTGTWTSNGGGCVLLDWNGSGTGVFTSATLPAFWNFTIAPPANATVTGWKLTFIINGPTPGAPEGGMANRAAKAGQPTLNIGTTTVFTCSTNCSGSTSMLNQNINVPNGSTFINYEVKLEVDANWSSGGNIMTVTVPPDGTIHINAPLAPVSQPAATGAPALSWWAMLLTAVLLGSSGIWLMRKHEGT